MQRRYLASGDRMVLVEFPEEISQEVNSQVHEMAAVVETTRIPGVAEWVPAYRTLGIVYNPMETSFRSLIESLEQIEGLGGQAQAGRSRRIEIPVSYGGEMGPDLDFVAQHNQLTTDEVIRLHTASEYLVYLLGFTPGFPYLGGMAPEIAAPRLAEPRSHVPAGSVAIGGSQTGIYPIESPGGWRIIGRTPLKLFDLSRNSPFLLKAGDSVRFRSITLEEFQRFEQLTE
ncbi:MAG: allophanate hydrolase [Acidobacteria bacterium]|nr:MAG: allophanate hydrolase [Acidobacteriota bacterium]